MVFQKRILVGCARKHKKRYRCQNCTTPSINKIIYKGSEEKNYANNRFSFFLICVIGDYGRNIRGISGLRRTTTYELTGMIRTTGRYGCIMERLCLTENIACLLYIVYNIIYNNILVCKCTICIILCFGLSSSDYHFVSQKSDKMIKNQKLISNQNNSEYEMSDSDRSF